MSLRIIKAGIADTLQDTGRYGYQSCGINPSGAMDKYALQVANALVGNELAEAALELHFPAPVLLFMRPALIALTGADFSPVVNGEPVPLRQCILVNKHDALQFTRPRSGARAYLAVAGGFQTEAWLGSRSTHLKAGAGGYHGRKLEKGDEIGFNEHRDLSHLLSGKHFRIFPWSTGDIPGSKSSEIHVLPGHEWRRLTEAAAQQFERQPFQVSGQADRMGYRLAHEPLETMAGEELLSSPVSFGTVQLLPGGQLIVLMADHQATGGYPRLAHVITADHPKLAQLKTGDSFNFRLTDQAAAEEAYIVQQQQLRQLQQSCYLKLQQYGCVY